VIVMVYLPVSLNVYARQEVPQLADLLNRADGVHLMVGRGAHPTNEPLGFKQQGILRRDRVVPLLVEKLRVRGKLVVTMDV